MNTAIRLGALCAAMVTIASLAATACGSDSGTGSTKDMTASKNDSKDTVSGPPGSVPCGMTHCLPPEGSDLEPCCMAPFESKCGVKSGNTCAEAPKPPPTGCPTIPPFMGLTFAACCTMDGQCGVDLTMLGMGCLDLSSALQLAMQMGQTISNAPAPASCTPGAAM